MARVRDLPKEEKDVNDPLNHPCEVHAYRQEVTIWRPRKPPYTGMAAFPIGHIGVCALCQKPTRGLKLYSDAYLEAQNLYLIPKEFTAKLWQEILEYNNQIKDMHGKRAAPQYELEWQDGELVNRYGKVAPRASSNGIEASVQSHGLIRKELKSADAYAPEQPEFPQENVQF